MGAFRRLSDSVAELKRMRVMPEWQGQGIGRTMLEALETEISSRGYVSIELDTTTNQTAAQKLYEHSGYEEIRRQESAQFELIFYRKELIK
jgi:ribosomal protein S18 acetylase RimI-like enzyme